jgi:transcriptional regulator with XRE-family HTH domain
MMLSNSIVAVPHLDIFDPPSATRNECRMLIGQRLRQLRQAKNLSQGDIEKRTGLLRYHISRVENGHMVPSIKTLEKYASALEVPMYRFFYEGSEPPKKPDLPAEIVGREWPELPRFARLLARMSARDQNVLLAMAQQMAGRRRE